MRNSHYYAFILYAALAAAAPAAAPPANDKAAVVARQFTGFPGLPSFSLPDLPGFTLPTAGFPLPTGDFPFPTGDFPFPLPTGDFPFPTGLGGFGLKRAEKEEIPPLTGLPTPTGLPTGLPFPTGLPTDFPFPTGLPTGFPFPSGLSFPSGLPLPLPTGLPHSSGYNTKAKRRARRYASPFDLGSLVSSAGGSSTENGLDNACQPVTLLFARGTTETGNMGTVVGPGLSSDTKSALSNSVNVQGVDYAADAAGIATEALGTGGEGTKAMVADVTAALDKCPDTQIVLTGYSQGAMLVHNTMSSLDSAAAAAVKAAVTFGDPFVGTMPANLAEGAFKSFCASGDGVCSAGVASSPSAGGTTSQSSLGHLGYGSDTETAAAFIQGLVTV